MALLQIAEPGQSPLPHQLKRAVGIDLGNIEDSADMTRCVHMFLLEEKVPIYENLANLNALPAKRFLFAGFPLFLKGCTGSPVRAVALIDENEGA